MQKSTNNQLLILIEGILNGGKTLVYDIIRKEDNFIYLDFSKWHYIMYSEVMEEQLGEKILKQIEPLIKSEKIFHEYEVFLREVGFLMKQFPDKNFVIKPVNTQFAKLQHERDPEWAKKVYEYLPTSIDNIYFLFVIRHPKTSWYTLNQKTTDSFIESWYRKEIFEVIKYADIVKVEELEKNDLLKSIITKTDLKNFVPFTDFDYYKTIDKDFDNIDVEMKEIEDKLAYVYDLFGYDLEDKNSELFIEDIKSRIEVCKADEVFD